MYIYICSPFARGTISFILAAAFKSWVGRTQLICQAKVLFHEIMTTSKPRMVKTTKWTQPVTNCTHLVSCIWKNRPNRNTFHCQCFLRKQHKHLRRSYGTLPTLHVVLHVINCPLKKNKHTNTHTQHFATHPKTPPQRFPFPPMASCFPECWPRRSQKWSPNHGVYATIAYASEDGQTQNAGAWAHRFFVYRRVVLVCFV